MNFLVAAILAAGILPSMVAISGSPEVGVGRFMGPLNFLKLGAPFILFHLAVSWRRLARRELFILGGSLAVLGLCTYLSASRCWFHHTQIREGMVLGLGLLAGISLSLLPEKHRTGVFVAWIAVILGSALLDLVAPAATDWLHAHVFDPDTRHYDVAETGRKVLAGIFGRQSIAKFLAWVPWLALGIGVMRRRWLVPAGIAAVLSTGAILATSQRGPFVGALAGWGVLALHQLLRRGNRRAAGIALAGLALSTVTTLVIVPRDILEVRLRSLVGLSGQGQYAETATQNGDKRLMMQVFSVKNIAAHPLGDSCIADQYFFDAGLRPTHSHHLILQQYRDRGWLWGTLHLGLWILALLGAWRGKTDSDSALAAGIAATLVLGLFDTPWFVLNHAIVMASFLVLGIRNRGKVE